MDEKTFEEALKELESIVEALEKEDVLLDDAVKNYNRGLELSKFCYDKLSEAQKLIIKIDGEKNKVDCE